MTDEAISAHQIPHRWRLVLWATIGTILLLPLIAMQFTNEIHWTAFDFAVAGTLLVGAAAAFEMTVRMTHNARYRTIIGTMLVLVVLLIWAEGAVGIFH